MAYTPAEINTIYQRVLQRDATSDEQVQWVSFSISFGNEATLDAIIDLPETNNFVDPIVRLYQAAFGRIPDQAGFNVNVDVLAHNPGSIHAGPVDIISMAKAFVVSQEFANLYNGGTLITDPNAKPTPAMIQAFYLNVLGRSGSSDEVQAWINTGASIAQILVGFSESAEFKAAVASDISAFLEAAAQGAQDYVGDLEDEDLTDGGGGVGVTRLFTDVVGETLTGTGADDTFRGVVDDGGGNTTYHVIDEAQGLGGTDTLELTVIDRAGTNEVEVNGTQVEVLSVTDLDTSTFDLSAMPNISVIVSESSTTPSTFKNVVNLVDVSAVNLEGGAHVTVIVENSVVEGAVDLSLDNNEAFNLGYRDEGGSDVVNAYNITVTGDNEGVRLLNTSLVTAITIQGTGDLLELNIDDFDDLVTIDAAALAGDLSTGATTWVFANDVTLTGSSGDDDLETDSDGNALTADLGTGADRIQVSELNADVTLDGGDGDDRLTISGAIVGGIPSANIENFETIEINAAMSGDQTIDSDDLGTDFNEIVLSADLGAGNDLTLEEFEGDLVIEASQSGAVIVESVDTSDTLDVIFNADPSTIESFQLSSLVTTGIEVVNFTNEGDDSNNHSVVMSASGTEAVNASSEGDFTLTINNGDALETVDLVAVEGVIDLTLTPDTPDGLVIRVGDFDAGSAIALDNDADQDEIVFGTFTSDTSITIDNFVADTGGDIIDLTAFGLDEGTEVFVDDTGPDATITFENSAGVEMVITLVGVTGVTADDIKQFNIES